MFGGRCHHISEKHILTAEQNVIIFVRSWRPAQETLQIIYSRARIYFFFVCCIFCAHRDVVFYFHSSFLFCMYLCIFYLLFRLKQSFPLVQMTGFPHMCNVVWFACLYACCTPHGRLFWLFGVFVYSSIWYTNENIQETVCLVFFKSQCCHIHLNFCY